jgi:hypothetical protein
MAMFEYIGETNRGFVQWRHYGLITYNGATAVRLKGIDDKYKDYAVVVTHPRIIPYKTLKEFRDNWRHV